ncbi:hypothetical protein ACFQH6_19550 [Halobacteriaceae archaeon GCM10025711]
MASREPQTGSVAGDGSSCTDAHDIVVIDRSSDGEPYRYVCPNGHANWDRTNNHIWCQSCRRQYENGEDIDPEHWSIYDKRDDVYIPWSAVRVKD